MRVRMMSMMMRMMMAAMQLSGSCSNTRTYTDWHQRTQQNTTCMPTASACMRAGMSANTRDQDWLLHGSWQHRIDRPWVFRDVELQDVMWGLNIIVIKPLAHISYRCEVPTP